jgi:hypothetical protein
MIGCFSTAAACTSKHSCWRPKVEARVTGPAGDQLYDNIRNRAYRPSVYPHVVMVERSCRVWLRIYTRVPVEIRRIVSKWDFKCKKAEHGWGPARTCGTVFSGLRLSESLSIGAKLRQLTVSYLARLIGSLSKISSLITLSRVQWVAFHMLGKYFGSHLATNQISLLPEFFSVPRACPNIHIVIVA